MIGACRPGGQSHLFDARTLPAEIFVNGGKDHLGGPILGVPEDPGRDGRQ